MSKLKAYYVRHTVRYHVEELVFATSPAEARQKAFDHEVEWSETVSDDERISWGGSVHRSPSEDPE